MRQIVVNYVIDLRGNISQYNRLILKLCLNDKDKH